MFDFLEKRIQPTARPGTAPPGGLLAFYWHFVGQARGLFGTMFVTGLAVALIDTLIPVFIGKLVRVAAIFDFATCGKSGSAWRIAERISTRLIESIPRSASMSIDVSIISSG